MSQIDNPEEKLDLVDSQDRPIGAIKRSEVLDLEKSKRGFTRAVLVFLINDKGELWIPMRAAHKKIAPGGLDASAGEHVGFGESYDGAAIRGLFEELHIQAKAGELSYIGTVPPFSGMPYFHKIYLYPWDDVLAYNEDDYSSYEWMTPAALLDRLRAGAKAKEILLPSVKLLMEKIT